MLKELGWLVVTFTDRYTEMKEDESWLLKTRVVENPVVTVTVTLKC